MAKKKKNDMAYVRSFKKTIKKTAAKRPKRKTAVKRNSLVFPVVNIKSPAKRRRKSVSMAKETKTTKRKHHSLSGSNRIGKFNVGSAINEIAGLTVGAILTSALASKIPLANAKIKALIPIAAGLILAKMPKIKSNELLSNGCKGAIVAGALGLIRQMVPSLPLLAGDDEVVQIPVTSEQARMLGFELADEEISGGAGDYVGLEDDGISGGSDDFVGLEDTVDISGSDFHM